MMELKLLLPQSSGKRARACQMELIMRKKETSDNLPKKGFSTGWSSPLLTILVVFL
ncbi:hypothetical protein Gotur_003249 [Gossypium turneri]